MKRSRRSSKKSRGFLKKLEADNIFFLASGLAFNLLICFIPLLLVILSILGFFLYSSQEITEHLRIYLGKMLPQASPKITADIMHLIKTRKLVGLIGFLGLLWAATRLFSSIRTVLDKTLEVTWPHGYLKEKMVDLFMVFVSGLLFLVSILLIGIFDLIKSFPDRLGISLPEVFRIDWLGRLVGLGGGYLFSVLLFLSYFASCPAADPAMG